jgi:hypothetical protein
VLLDERPSGGGRLEASVAEKMTFQKKADGAIFGYARMDLLDMEDDKNLKWGSWNERPWQPPQVNKLVQSFLSNGVDRFSPMKAIHLVARPADLVSTSYSKTLRPTAESEVETETTETTETFLPLLELRTQLHGKYRLRPAGGMHRLKALEIWLGQLKREYDLLTKERKALAAQPEGAALPEDIAMDKFTSKPRRDALAETLDLKGQWLVILYDHCEFLCPPIPT